MCFNYLRHIAVVFLLAYIKASARAFITGAHYLHLYIQIEELIIPTISTLFMPKQIIKSLLSACAIL